MRSWRSPSPRPAVPLSPTVPAAPHPRAQRVPTIGFGATAIGVVLVASSVLVLVDRFRATRPHMPWNFVAWHGDYAQRWSFVIWAVGDTTEPGYAHSALAGILMIVGGSLAHWAFRRGKTWMGFPVTSGTGQFTWVVLSAGLGLALSNLAWGWTLARSGTWQPTFVAFASVPAAIVLIYGARRTVVVTGAVMGAFLTTPAALLAVNFGCRPLGLPDVVGATTGMWASALLAFALCRLLPWMGDPTVSVPRCHPHKPHDFVETSRQGPQWLLRRMLADFTDAQFIGSEWAGAGLLMGTLASYLIDPALASTAGELLPRLMIAQVLTSATAIYLWRGRWAIYGWYPTFVPVVSVAPAAVVVFNGSVVAIILGAILGALIGPPLAAAIARRLPLDFHPFIGNVVSMSITTTIVVMALRVAPKFIGLS
jgi:hypothetical protein